MATVPLSLVAEIQRPSGARVENEYNTMLFHNQHSTCTDTGVDRSRTSRADWKCNKHNEIFGLMSTYVPLFAPVSSSIRLG